VRDNGCSFGLSIDILLLVSWSMASLVTANAAENWGGRRFG